MLDDGNEPVVGVDDVVSRVKVERFLLLSPGGYGIPGSGQLDRLVVDAELELVELTVLTDDDTAPVGIPGCTGLALDSMREERIRKRREGVEHCAGLLQQLLELDGRAFKRRIRLSLESQDLALVHVLSIRIGSQALVP